MLLFFSMLLFLLFKYNWDLKFQVFFFRFSEFFRHFVEAQKDKSNFCYHRLQQS